VWLASDNEFDIGGEGSFYVVKHKHSPDNGENWKAADTVSNPNIKSWNPLRIVISDNVIHVGWYGYGSYRRSLDGGINWESPVPNLFPENFRAIAVAGPRVCIFGDSYVESITDAAELYYRYSSNYGENWTPLNRLTREVGCSAGPSAAFSGSAIHVVWVDDRDNANRYFDIYYKRNPTGIMMSILQPDLDIYNDRAGLQRNIMTFKIMNPSKETLNTGKSFCLINSSFLHNPDGMDGPSKDTLLKDISYELVTHPIFSRIPKTPTNPIFDLTQCMDKIKISMDFPSALRRGEIKTGKANINFLDENIPVGLYIGMILVKATGTNGVEAASDSFSVAVQIGRGRLPFSSREIIRFEPVPVESRGDR
jgi:hypothetical protein